MFVDTTAYGPQNEARLDGLNRKIAAEIVAGCKKQPGAAAQPVQREEAIQAAAIQLLEASGYTVLQTSLRMRRVQCPECDEWFRPHFAAGTTPGVPDLLVAGGRLPVGVWIGVEVKAPKGAVRPEQRALANDGRIIIVRSAADALAGVQRIEQALALAIGGAHG
jgi:hypothetical protein